MTPGDVLWIFFMLSALQPVLKQRFLEAMRQRLIAKIEHDRDSRVILLVHRQETMSFLGFPVLRYIDVNDSEEVLRAIHLTDSAVPLDIVLHTPGGLVLATLQIARAIHKHKGKVTAFVPHYAMSGGTLIALAANETQGAPVRKTHKIPFRTARRSFQGRPRPSRRLAGSGTRGSRIFHCWSVRSRLWHIPVLLP